MVLITNKIINYFMIVLIEQLTLLDDLSSIKSGSIKGRCTGVFSGSVSNKSAFSSPTPSIFLASPLKYSINISNAPLIFSLDMYRHEHLIKITCTPTSLFTSGLLQYAAERCVVCITMVACIMFI